MKRNSTSNNSRILTHVLIACFALASGTSAFAQGSSESDAHGASETNKQVCSNRTLFGEYGTQIEGTILGPNLSLRTLTLVHYNGSGQFTGVDHVVLDGNPPDQEWRHPPEPIRSTRIALDRLQLKSHPETRPSHITSS